MTETDPVAAQLYLIDTLTTKYAWALAEENKAFEALNAARTVRDEAEEQRRLLDGELQQAQRDLVELKINQ